MGNLDLIDWTMETAKELRTPNDLAPTVNDSASTAPIDGGEAILRSDDWLLMSEPGTEITSPLPATGLPPGQAPDRPSTSATSSVIEPETEEPALRTPAPDMHAALLQAIVGPDIHTSKADRYRAIDLRWTLRDIAADRFRSTPINKLDLQILLEMKLVELRGGVPHLTNTGVTAII